MAKTLSPGHGWATQHSAHVIVSYALPPNLVTPGLFWEMTCCTWQLHLLTQEPLPDNTQATPRAKAVCHQAPWIPIKPSFTRSPLTHHKLEGDPSWMPLSGFWRSHVLSQPSSKLDTSTFWGGFFLVTIVIIKQLLGIYVLDTDLRILCAMQFNLHTTLCSRNLYHLITF